MLMVPDTSGRVKPLRGLARLRYQLSIGMLLTVVAPTLVRAEFSFEKFQNSVGGVNTVIACALGLIIGIALFRRLAVYPGVRGYEFIMPSFAAAYGLVGGILLIIRADYIVSVLFSSFTAAIVLFFFIYYVTQRQSTRLFAIVPEGRAEALALLPQANWTFLREPSIPPYPISGIVADFHTDLTDDWERFIADATLAGVPCYHVKQLAESLTGQVELEHLSENSFGALIPNHAYLKAKRVADLIVCLFALPAMAVLTAVVATLIKLDSPGPVFFTQQRMGYRGQPFKVFKFRSMRVAEDRPECERAHSITKDGDHRITKLGAFLRRTRIDELPQMINIIKGEMSWIGPRPEAIPLSQWYEGELPFYRYRHAVLPGITGWAQVNQGHVAELSDVHLKLCYDFYYLKNFSAWLDGLIVFRTIQTVFTGHGSR